MKHILVVSPIPSHPQFQGNSARIFRLMKMFQLIGYKVHFVYFGMEGMTEQQQLTMTDCWDFFHYVQPIGPAASPSYIEYYDIDDWYDMRVSDLVETLCRRWSFDICLTNYVWFSKVLEVVPQATQKIIDTHDVFGDRHIVAKKAGLDPVWFYTTKELEKFGLQRADLIIAIQDEERDYFKSITDVPTEVIGYVVPKQHAIERTTKESSKIRIGYIGSGNPFNVQSMLGFQAQIMLHPELLNRFDFYLAGTICKSIKEHNEVYTICGMVDELEDFYGQIDIAVNPMVGGTGLKIKSLEAMSFGKPLVGTIDAMVGIRVLDEMQQCDSIEEMVMLLQASNEERLVQLARNSYDAFNTYNKRFTTKFTELF
ncbi:MAG: glycosyltransferase involved in cell wall biosynthesis [Oleiphilaceae bacterium]|jgi:glycosyltransferase involved in cell wall biosynthesis